MNDRPTASEGPSTVNDELFQHLVESSTDFAIYAVAPDGTATIWNIGAERLFGYPASDILGTSGDVVFTAADRAAGVPQKERDEARAKGRAEDERWHRRRDGSLFWASGSLVPLRDPANGFVKIVRDRTAQHRAEMELAEKEERFRLLAISIPQLVFRTLPGGDRLWGSPQWIDFTGLSLEESLGLGWLNAIHPEDRAATDAAWDGAVERGEYYVEHRVRRGTDGEYRWHQTRARPIAAAYGETGHGKTGQEDTRQEDTGHKDIGQKDAGKGILGRGDWVGTMTDIHDLRGLKDRQGVLVAELQHRTRNLLAVVQSIAGQTLRKTTSLEAFRTEFEGRLRALSRVQGILARVDHGDIDLRGLLDAELIAHGDGALETGRITVDGPSVALPAISAQALGLALHELATNAVKYGALAQPTGRLAVRWTIEGGEAGPRAALEWRESGVAMPETTAPRRKGYGTELIERALPYQLRAKTRLEFGPDGVRCTIRVPIRIPAGGIGAEGDHG